MTLRKRIMSCVMAGVLLCGSCLPVNATGLKEAEQKKKQLEEQKKNAESEKTSLGVQLDKIVADMKKAEKEMTDKEKDIAKAEEELISAKVEEQTQYENMKKRIKYMYENGNTNYVELLLQAKNLTDFLNRAEYATQMSNYDREMLKKLQQLVKEVEKKEAALQRDYEKLSALQKNLTEKQAEVEKLLKEKASELANIDTEMKEVNVLIEKAKEAERRRKEAEETARRQAQEAARREQEKKSAAASRPPVVSGNGFFTHPCPGMSYQSSYFGEVRQGIGDSRPHKGHDYAASQGTPIYAAAAGKVVIAGYSNSAGNWVVINHGNGLVSKYMHMYTTPYVSAGESVSKGQNIGGVGTTGQSTGNHLHFQVELNGVAVNPSNYM